MTRKFALVAGTVLLILGILNVFIDRLEVYGFQILLHIAAGVLGIWAYRRSSGYQFTKWYSITALIFATLGFMGITQLLDLIKLTMFHYWFYLISGLLGLWIYLTIRQSNANSAPADEKN